MTESSSAKGASGGRCRGSRSAKAAEATSLSTTASGREGTAAAPKQGEAGSTSSPNSSEKSCNNSIRPTSPRTSCPPAVGTTQMEQQLLALDLQVDAQGLLQLQLLKSYFVSRNPNDFSPLAKLVHTSDSTLLPIQPIKALLAKGNVDIVDGGGCGWPPLHLALLGGDARLKKVKLLIEHRANLELSPHHVRGRTAIQLAAANRRRRACMPHCGGCLAVVAGDRPGTRPWCIAQHGSRREGYARMQPAARQICGRDRACCKRAAVRIAALEAGNAETAAMLQEKARAVQERAQMELLKKPRGLQLVLVAAAFQPAVKKGKKKAKAAR